MQRTGPTDQLNREIVNPAGIVAKRLHMLKAIRPFDTGRHDIAITMFDKIRKYFCEILRIHLSFRQIEENAALGTTALAILCQEAASAFGGFGFSHDLLDELQTALFDQ